MSEFYNWKNKAQSFWFEDGYYVFFPSYPASCMLLALYRHRHDDFSQHNESKYLFSFVFLSIHLIMSLINNYNWSQVNFSGSNIFLFQENSIIICHFKVFAFFPLPLLFLILVPKSFCLIGYFKTIGVSKVKWLIFYSFRT